MCLQGTCYKRGTSFHAASARCRAAFAPTLSFATSASSAATKSSLPADACARSSWNKEAVFSKPAAASAETARMPAAPVAWPRGTRSDATRAPEQGRDSWRYIGAGAAVKAKELATPPAAAKANTCGKHSRGAARPRSALWSANSRRGKPFTHDSGGVQKRTDAPHVKSYASGALAARTSASVIRTPAMDLLRCRLSCGAAGVTRPVGGTVWLLPRICAYCSGKNHYQKDHTQ